MIKKYTDEYLPSIIELFYNSIHNIPEKYYTKKQLNAWAPLEKKQDFLCQWNAQLLENYTFVNLHNDNIIGFIEMDKSGYIDKLFVSPLFQKKGSAQSLYNEVELIAKKNKINTLKTHASKVAKPFFLKNGFIVNEKQIVIRNNTELENYIMTKRLF